MLVRNYRSHATLLAVPNQLFYDGRLEAAAPQDALLAPAAWGQLRLAAGAHQFLLQSYSRCSTYVAFHWPVPSPCFRLLSPWPKLPTKDASVPTIGAEWTRAFVQICPLCLVGLNMSFIFLISSR